MQIGQLLQATVLENDAGKILLSVGHRQLSAESSLSFRPGEVLTLQVRELGAQPVLKIIAALQESAVALAVRTLLPRYGPTTPLLANLSLLAHTPKPPLPPPISAVAATLVRNLPDVAALATPQGLKTAIQNSGILLENRLALATHTPATADPLESDFKANLLRLIQLVRNWPGSDQTPSAPSAPAGRPAAAQAQGPSPQPAPSDPAGNRPPTSSASPSPPTPPPATVAADPKTPPGTARCADAKPAACHRDCRNPAAATPRCRPCYAHRIAGGHGPQPTGKPASSGCRRTQSTATVCGRGADTAVTGAGEYRFAQPAWPRPPGPAAANRGGAGENAPEPARQPAARGRSPARRVAVRHPCAA